MTLTTYMQFGNQNKALLKVILLAIVLRCAHAIHAKMV